MASQDLRAAPRRHRASVICGDPAHPPLPRQGSTLPSGSAGNFISGRQLSAYKYRYDDFGNTTRLVGPGAGTTEAPVGARRLLWGSASWTAADTAYLCYDEFSRLILSKGQDTDRDQAALYFHDGLDRRDFRYKFAHSNQGQEWQELSYVGMSEMLLREQVWGGNESTYDYSSGGRRMAQNTRGTSGSGMRYYATDAQGSVEALEDPSGTIAANET